MALSPSQARLDTVVVSNVTPRVEGGRYATKRVTGEKLRVEADLFKDGHDQLAAVLKWRKKGAREWNETPMTPGENDRWHAEIAVDEIGEYRYTVEAWGDDFHSWLHDFERRLTGDQENFETEIEEGRVILNRAADRAARARAHEDAEAIDSLAAALMRTKPKDVPATFGDPLVVELLDRHPNRALSTQLDPALPLRVDRPEARFSAWA